jgi:GNAT superfamily N-acetyltransferase
MSYVIRPLQAGDSFGTFSLGDPSQVPLKTFLKRDAKRFHQQDLAKTILIVDAASDRLAGYATTVCAQLSIEEYVNPVEIDGYRYSDFPAIKLARLAVDKREQGKGVGSTLVDFLLGFVLQHIQPHIGCRFLLVDAKRDSIGFYLKKGFSELVSKQKEPAVTTTPMFIDLYKLRT